MKALVVRILLLMLPLQFLWAGAALACQHEPDPGATHFGHHAVAKSQVDPAGDTKPPVSGGDCSVCHLASSQPPFAEAVVMLLDGADAPQRGTSLRPTGQHADIPDRPDWQPLLS